VAALEELRTRLAEIDDLSALIRLARWDQQTMMPHDGASSRAHQIAAIERQTHELAVADEVGGWLEELERDGRQLSDLDRDVVRLARRDWERSRRVPTELVGELAQAASEGELVWRAAREAADFGAFQSALARNVELARAYAACFDDAARPYDALLADYDFGVSTERLQIVFGALVEGLAPLLAAAPDGPDRLATIDIPIEAQKVAVLGTLARLGVEQAGWRVDVSAHPFSESIGRLDQRITTRYESRGVQSLIAALHEFGHALYERQIAPELERTNLGSGTSMSIHESQSKLWENHVGSSRAFASVLAAELRRGGQAIDPDELYAGLRQVRRSPIRVSSDQLSYPLHIVLRFELELALIEGRLDVADLPVAWNDGMRRMLGIEVSDDANGVLQDIHWAAGSFGYFPSYALGCLIAAQLWQQIEIDLGSQDEALASADVAAIREWLAERVHRHGRRLDTEPLVKHATGRGLEVEPFLAHAALLVEI
jgi:carboxypeptidase Taq